MDFVERKRREQRERGLPSKEERNISPPPIKQTRPRLGFLCPPLNFTKKECFFSRPRILLKKQKNKRAGGRVIITLLFHARTHARA